MDKIRLEPMTREMCHELYRRFVNDPAIGHYYEYIYSAEKADEYYDRNINGGRLLFAVMLGNEIIGEVKLKDIDREKRECSMGIHLRDDSVKGKGYGTEAERQMLEYAFDELEMKAVNADAAIKNSRSRHVLENLGFRFLREDESFAYYRCER